ncbi:MAG: hypothetical protein ABI663_21755 [Chryseolinea sp.]
MKNFTRYILLTLIIGMSSCDPSSIEKEADIGKDYFPMMKGHFQIYDVNEIIYTLGDPDTFIYQLKTVVIDSFLNSESTYTYVIHRSVRDDASEPWEYKDTWSSRLVNGQVIESEENIDFVKLVVPFEVGIKWNGNAFNNLEAENYELESSESKTFNDVTFADCITIKQKDNQDFIVNLEKRSESYAKNVGLVYRENTQLFYCTDTNSGCIGQQIVDEGTIYKQTFVEHGVE